MGSWQEIDAAGRLMQPFEKAILRQNSKLEKIWFGYLDQKDQLSKRNCWTISDVLCLGL